MNFISKEIEDYVVSNSQAIPPYLDELERVTHMRTLAPQMLSGKLVGRLLSFISHLIKPMCIVEIGTFTGYSSLCLAEGLLPGGVLHTFEVNDELLPIIDTFHKKSPYHEKIKVHIGRGEELLPNMNIVPDLAFLDAGKMNYLEHYNIVLDKMNTGGIIVVDNVLWSGKVLEPATDEDTKSLQAFNDFISADARVIQVMLPIRDGLTLIRKTA